jgi:hypothetical protein
MKDMKGAEQGSLYGISKFTKLTEWEAEELRQKET